MSYSPYYGTPGTGTGWENDAGGLTPIQAPALDNMEQGIVNAHLGLDEVAPGPNGSRVVSAAKLPDLSGTYTPLNLSGTYATRPAANTVKAGTLYFATDVPEVYRSNGTTWSVVAAGGNELGYAEITADFSTTSTTAVDVTGLSVTCTVGERPVLVKFDGEVKNNTSLAYVRGWIVVDGTQAAIFGGPANGTNDFHPSHREKRVSGLTPGSSHTFKIQLASVSGGGTSLITGSSGDPAFIQVVTL